MINFWSPGDIIVWRGIFRNRVWNALTIIVVKDSPEEIIMTLLPGTECRTERDYPKGKEHAKRRWNFKDKAWKLEKYFWHTNRLLLIVEPGKYYSTILFWNHQSDEFVCYYINFQSPFQRHTCGIDTLDLDLDLVISPDLSYEWKDVDEYQKAIENGIISQHEILGIESAKREILEKLEKRQYPFDGSWLDWMPDRRWKPPTLPENWDKI
jgi:protein associated with RNAse G/E